MTSVSHLTVKATRRAMLERMTPEQREAWLAKMRAACEKAKASRESRA